MDDHSNKDSLPSKPRCDPKMVRWLIFGHQHWGILPFKRDLRGMCHLHLCSSRMRAWTCSAAGSFYACCIGFTAGGSISDVYNIYILIPTLCERHGSWRLTKQGAMCHGSGVYHQMMRMTKVAPCSRWVATTEGFCQRSRTEMLFPLLNESRSFNIKLFPLPLVMTPRFCLSATSETPSSGHHQPCVGRFDGWVDARYGRGICLDD